MSEVFPKTEEALCRHPYRDLIMDTDRLCSQVVNLTSDVIFSKTIPGLGVLIALVPSCPLKPEDIYLAAIICVHDWGGAGWNDTNAASSRQYSKTVQSIGISIRGIAEPNERYQLQNKYLIWGWLYIIKEMQDKGTWCAGCVATMMHKQPVGHMDVTPLRADDACRRRVVMNPGNVSNSEPTINLPQGRSPGSRNGRIVDPEDRNFAISYQLTGEALSCVDLLSAIFYAVATAAQDEDDVVCEDLGGVNEMQNVEYQIHGAPRPTSSGYLFTYGLVRAGMKLLAEQFYSKGNCGGMTFTFEYTGDILAGGRIRESDFARRVAGTVKDNVTLGVASS